MTRRLGHCPITQSLCLCPPQRSRQPVGVLRVSWAPWGCGHGVSLQSTISSPLSGGQCVMVVGLFQATAPSGWVMGIMRRSCIRQSSGKCGVCNGVGGEGKALPYFLVSVLIATLQTLYLSCTQCCAASNCMKLCHGFGFSLPSPPPASSSGASQFGPMPL